MKALIIYIAGVLTPFAIVALVEVWDSIQCIRASLRYKRAWKKFTEEWHAMAEAKRADFLANPPHHSNLQYADNQSAWFAYRWQGGATTDV